jgi:membrane protease YdiL (CAAX protease family)
MNRNLKIITGFLLLFALYHAAEYFVLFQNNPIAFLILQVIFFITAWLIARWQKFKGLSAWGMDTGRNWFKTLLLGMFMGVVLYLLPYLAGLALGSEVITNIPRAGIIIPQLGLFCFGVFFSSFSEDILTRGYLFKHLGDKLPPIVFVVISAAVYLLNHIYRLTSGWKTCTYLFMLGVLFAIPLVLTRRLWFTGGMHWIGNTVFYLTHNIIGTKTVDGHLAPNTIFIICIIVLMPVVIWVTRFFRLSPQFNGETVKVTTG